MEANRYRGGPVKHRRILRDNDLKYWFKPSARRMMNAQGVPRISSTVYDPIAKYAQGMLYKVLDKSLTVAFTENRKTVLLRDLELVLGDKFIAPRGSLKRCTDDTAPSEQCRYFSKANFNRLVRQLGQQSFENRSNPDFGTIDVRYRYDFIDAIMAYTEKVILDLISYALLAMDHANKSTLGSEDVEYVIATRKDCDD